jgi:hypothetical protein
LVVFLIFIQKREQVPQYQFKFLFKYNYKIRVSEQPETLSL